jgi:DNA invertase Pin-like site-specific DNA recombinase
MSRLLRAALYLRVSTDEQSTDNQRQALTEVAERHGWSIATVYEDHGISGAKGRDKRPALDRLLKDATRRKFDVVLAWSVDRMGRSLPDLLATLQELHAAKVDLFLYQQAIDTTSPAGKAMFGMLGVFAEFERSMIQARVKAGLARTRAEGKRLGRPPLSPEIRMRVHDLRNAKVSVRAIASRLGIAKSSVQAILDQGGHAHS